MATNSPQALGAKVEEQEKRLDWLDGERRNSTRRIAALEKELAVRDKEIQALRQRFENLEEKSSRATTQFNKATQSESRLQLLRDEMLKAIEQNDQRRVVSETEMEKLRRIELEGYQRELAELRKLLDELKPLQNEMRLRESEDARLAVLIGSLQSRSTELNHDVESNRLDINFLQETLAGQTGDTSRTQASLQGALARLDGLETRVDVTSDQMMKNRTTGQQLSNAMDDLRQAWKDMIDQIRMSELQRKQKMDSWQAALEDNVSVMERYAKEWVKYNDEYKAAKMALGQLAEWQEGIDLRQSEMSELTRVEAERLRSRQEVFSNEFNKRLKNFEIDLEQHLSALQRRDKQIADRLEELVAILESVRVDVATLWRIQNAQAEAIKKWPRLFSEEVEKAISQNPNSRRQPALVPVREE